MTGVVGMNVPTHLEHLLHARASDKSTSLPGGRFRDEVPSDRKEAKTCFLDQSSAGGATILLPYLKSFFNRCSTLPVTWLILRLKAHYE